MANLKRLTSGVLLGLGVLLVLVGFTAALGFTPSGVFASVAAIAALLYAGAVSFGARPVTAGTASRIPDPLDPVSLVVFDLDKACRGRALGRPACERRLPRTSRRRDRTPLHCCAVGYAGALSLSTQRTDRRVRCAPRTQRGRRDRLRHSPFDRGGDRRQRLIPCSADADATRDVCPCGLSAAPRVIRSTSRRGR